jgi:DNA repair exonuclease SbcCD ATPase subunit
MNGLVKDKLSEIKDSNLKVKYDMELAAEKIKLQKESIDDSKKLNDTEIEKKQAEVTESEQQIKKLNSDIQLIQKHIAVLQSKINDKMSVEKKSSKLLQFESKLESRIKKIEKEISFYEENTNCPTCKQGISESFRTEAVNRNNQTKGEIVSGIGEIEKEIKTTSERLQVINDVLKHINAHNNEVVKHNSTISAVNSYINKLQKEIIELSHRKDTLEEDNQKLKELKVELQKLIEQQQKLSEEKQYYDYASTLLKDTGIKTRIIKQYLPIMNKLINKYLTAMDFFVNFNINENFEETIKSRHRDDFSYANFSEGEKMRIDLALLFTWRQIAKLKNSTNTNLLILDEVFDSSLDTVGTEEFLKLLHEMGTDTNVFVISHKGDQLFDKFRSVIKFEKHNNFSRITK